VAWLADDEAEADGDATRDTNGCVQVQVEARGFAGLRKSVHLVLKRSDSHSSVIDEDGAADDAVAGGESGDLARDLREETATSERDARLAGGVRLLSWRDDER
jgi:hypothetical protein